MGGSIDRGTGQGGDSQRDRLLWALLFGKDPLGDIARELGVKADAEHVYGALHGTKPPSDGTAPDLGKLEGFDDALDAILNRFGSRLGDVDTGASGKTSNIDFDAGGRHYTVFSQGHGRTHVEESWTDSAGREHAVDVFRQSGHDALISHQTSWTDSDGRHNETQRSDGSSESTVHHPNGSRESSWTDRDGTRTEIATDPDGNMKWLRTTPDGKESHGSGPPPAHGGPGHQSGDGEGSDTGGVNPAEERLKQAGRPQAIVRPPADDTTENELDLRPDKVGQFIHLDPLGPVPGGPPSRDDRVDPNSDGLERLRQLLGPGIMFHWDDGSSDDPHKNWLDKASK
jgi:hypothetical protein